MVWNYTRRAAAATARRAGRCRARLRARAAAAARRARAGRVWFSPIPHLGLLLRERVALRLHVLLPLRERVEAVIVPCSSKPILIQCAPRQIRRVKRNSCVVWL